MKPHRIAVKNQLITYCTKGDNPHPTNTLLFLHGWRANAHIWAPVIAHLSTDHMTYYLLDLPGFGTSETPKHPFTTHDYAEVVRAVITKLNLKNLTLVGHSFGGRIALALAAAHPNLLKKLILINSAGISKNTTKKKLVRTAARIVKPFFKPSWMQGLRAKIYKKIGSEDYLETPELQATFQNIIDEDLTPLLSKIQHPTHLIWGEDDTQTPVEDAHTMKREIPNATLTILKNTGHFTFLDQPEKVAHEIASFLIARSSPL